MNDYAAFLEAKGQIEADAGFEPLWLPPFLFDFQRDLVSWAIRKGRAAIFADCGMGKTPMALVWAENMRRKTGCPVLILTPLAVAAQIAREGQKFGIPVAISRDGSVAGPITVTNYERLHHFNRDDWAAVVCDESSAIKAFSGETRKQVTAFLRHIPYRLLATATAAPNDYTELGTSSEALGYLGHMDMLSRFFTDKGSFTRISEKAFEPKYRFKGHAEGSFWRWVSSWARALRRPSDLGYSDEAFVLPPLRHQVHVVEATTAPEGMLFALPAIGLDEERDEARRTITERCALVKQLVDGSWASGSREPWVIWVQLNAEQEEMERLFGQDAYSVHGALSIEEKEARLEGFIAGERPVLITKPAVAAWGLNLQFVSRMAFFPSHSYEQYYQAIRRAWRFGQTRPVTVDVVVTSGSARVMESIERKTTQADTMFSRLVAHMNHALTIERTRAFTTTLEVPTWLQAS